MIRRAPEHLRKDVWRCKLYVDNIEAITEILGYSGRQVEIKIPGFRLESPQDLKEVGRRRLHAIDLCLADPYITVSLDDLSGSIFASEATPEAIGLVDQVERVLRSCRR